MGMKNMGKNMWQTLLKIKITLLIIVIHLMNFAHYHLEFFFILFFLLQTPTSEEMAVLIHSFIYKNVML